LAKKLHIPFKWLCCLLFFSLRQVAGFFPDAVPLQNAAAAHDKHVQAAVPLFTDTFFTHVAVNMLANDLDDAGNILRNATNKGRKQRYYLNAPTQQFSCSPRILYPETRQDYYICEKETKSGVYQWQDCFLPAYYTFLFRLALF
jgi:hypothetical protein